MDSSLLNDLQLRAGEVLTEPGEPMIFVIIVLVRITSSPVRPSVHQSVRHLFLKREPATYQVYCFEWFADFLEL